MLGTQIPTKIAWVAPRLSSGERNQIETLRRKLRKAEPMKKYLLFIFSFWGLWTVGLDKYLTYDELGEPESLEAAEPNMMVELIDEKKEERDKYRFFNSLLDLLDGLERSGEKVTIKSLKQFAEDFLAMPSIDRT